MIGKYMIVTTDPDVTRKVFSYNDPETLLMGVISSYISFEEAAHNYPHGKSQLFFLKWQENCTYLLHI